jgi:membrane protein implicated in regulation of membrane protease activity
VKKIGIIGTLLSLVTALFLGSQVVKGMYGNEIAWPETGFSIYYYTTEALAYSGLIQVVVLLIVGLALLLSTLLHSTLVSKTLSGVAGITSLAGIVIILQWLLPNWSELANRESICYISPPQLLQMESLFVQSAIVMLVSLILAGLIGIVERNPDKIVTAGYILSFLSGLIALIYGLATGGLIVSTYGDIQWAMIAYIIASIGYVGLAAAFYRPITQPEEHPDIQEQETDSQT